MTKPFGCPIRSTRFLMPVLFLVFIVSSGFGRSGFAQTADENLDAGEKQVEETAQPPQQNPKVIRIDVRGNQVISTSAILNNMKTRPGVELSQQMVNEDIKRLYATGFFQDIRIDLEESAEGVRLIVVVEDKPVIRHIVIEGSQLLKERDIRKELGLIEGQTLDELLIKQGVNKVRDRYANKGFRFVNVRYRVDTDRATKEATVTVTIEEGAKFRIGEVRFEGATSFKARRLKKLMRMKAKNYWLLRRGVFHEDKFQDDLDRLTAFYQSEGFLDVRINHDFAYDEAKGTIAVVIQVEEGKRYETGRVEIKGVKVIQESEVWQRLVMLPGATFSQQGLAKEMQSIQEFYYRFGYMNVQILPDVQVHKEEAKVDVAYQINEGDLYFVDKVKVRGNTKTKDIVVRRELRIQPGDKFDGDAIDRSKQRLENLGFFDEVAYETEPGSAPNRKDIVFKIKEKRTGELSFGAGVSSIDQFVGFGEIAQRNFDLLNWPRFTGAGQNISLRGRWGTITRDLSFNFTEPYLFNKPISFGLDVYDVRTENRNVDFEEERMGLGPTFSRAFWEFFRAGLGYKIERVKLFDLESDAPPTVQLFNGNTWLSRLRAFLSRDTRDNVFSPTKGWSASASGELIGTFLGGEEDYYILQVNSSKYWNFDLFGGKHVIEWRVRGAVADTAGSDEVPVFDRFYAGGFGTVRGFNYRRVSPLEAGSAVGGASMVIVNLEYTFPIAYLNYFKGAIFVDAGDVERDSYELHLDEFRVSVGPGIKVTTPIGPVAFYWGFPVANKDTEDKLGRLEFSLSRSF